MLITLKDDIAKYFSPCLLTFAIYLIAICAFKLGSGFDAFFVRAAFVVFMAVCIVKKKVFVLSEHFKYVLFFWSFYFISIFWAANDDEVFFNINNCVQIIGIAFSIPLFVNEKEDIDRVLHVLLLAFWASIIRLYFYADELGSYRIGEEIGLNANTFGVYAALGVLISYYFYDKFYKGIISSFFNKYFIYMLFFASGSMLSGSKKAFAFFVVGIFLYELLSSSKWTILFKATIMVILTSGLLWLIFNNDSLYYLIGHRLERMYYVLFTSYSINDTSTTERIFYITQGLNLFLENPILGYGGNNFVQYMRDIGYWEHIAYSHCNFVEILSTLGSVGFFLYYTIWFKTVCRLYRLFRENFDKQCLILLILIFMSLVMDFARVSYANIMNQVLLGIGLAYTKFSQNEDNTINEENVIDEENGVNEQVNVDIK